jgi:alkanesulfonate monooxygenase SsuD/methylene tetrahydromethanopterin reductase-like flavin-dependent oxidoreductase (luciferase family)
VTDFGLQVHSDLAGAAWKAEMHRLLHDLPPHFSTIWLPDHLQYQGRPWFDTWTRLTWLAATFPRYRVGTMVIGQGYRNPGLLGVMAATLQDASGGRLILGMGAGWLEEEYRAFNYEYPSPGTRVAQLAEALALLKTLWTESPATYEGEWYRLQNAVCPQPEVPIPIMVGTNGPRALKVVARLADWWVWDGPWEPTYRPPYEILKQECAAIGRPFESITKVSELAISLPPDPATFQPSYQHSYYADQEFGIAGPTPEDVIREVERLVDVGVQHIAVSLRDPDQYQRFFSDVLPVVRLTPQT